MKYFSELIQMLIGSSIHHYQSVLRFKALAQWFLVYFADKGKMGFLYSKTGVYRGINYFSYFCSKT